MNLTMIGTGYVGLVTGTCFANSGNHVTCVDIDQAKIDGLRQGKVPIYEPGLSEMVLRNTEAGRLHFTTDLADAVAPADMVYLAVGTPPAADGSADLTALRTVVASIAPHLRDDAIVVIKSTVPVGTNAETYATERINREGMPGCQQPRVPERRRRHRRLHQTRPCRCRSAVTSGI